MPVPSGACPCRYSLTGTCKPGEELFLSIAGSQWDMSRSMVGLRYNQALAHIEYVDRGGKVLDKALRYDSGQSKAPALSGTTSGTVPANAAKVIMEGSFSCNWSSAQTTAAETVSVLVTFNVDPASGSSHP